MKKPIFGYAICVISVLSFIFFTCFSNHSSAQIITTVAGNGALGFSGDGTPATAAQLDYPLGIVLDKYGNLFIADAHNSRIRKVNNSGIITTIAGNGTGGYVGDGMPATSSELFQPEGLFTDSLGNVYVADYDNYRVRKIDKSGIINTIAGTSIGFYSGDGIPATSSNILPTDVAIDSFGAIYIADGNHRIRKVTSGIINTIAGNGMPGYSGDGYSATTAQIKGATGIALDGMGNLYIADWQNNNVRKVDTHGIITTFAGTGVAGYSGDGGLATTAKMNGPGYLSTDGCGNVYVAELLNSLIRKIDPVGVISTIAGNTRIGGYSGDGGPATAAGIASPYCIKVDAFMNIYFADANNNVIRKISTANHPPSFNMGHVQYLDVCMDTTLMAINSLLSITDVDTLQSETWSLLFGPSHGTTFAAYNATSTTGVITPSGLSYTPATGFTGYDTFKIKVSDCGNAADSVAFYVNVTNCTLGLPNEPQQTSLQVYPNPNDGSFFVSLSAQVVEPEYIAVTNTVGEMVMEIEAVTNKPVEIKLNVPPGVYFLNIATKESRVNTKVVVGLQ